MELGISTWVKFLLFCLHEQNKQNRGWHCWRMSPVHQDRLANGILANGNMRSSPFFL